MAVVTKFPSSLSLAQAVLLVFLFLAASLNRCRSSPASSGLPSSADGGQQPAALTEQEAVNMNVSNLGEALFFISGVFISAVQPQPSPKVALQWLFPRVRLVSDRIRSFPTIFDIEKAKWSASSVEVSPVMTWLKIGQLGPGDVLQALCNDTLGKNVVTVLHVNNPTVSRDFRDISRYLTQLLDSIGVPVISWDPDFSTSLQTALEFFKARDRAVWPGHQT